MTTFLTSSAFAILTTLMSPTLASADAPEKAEAASNACFSASIFAERSGWMLSGTSSCTQAYHSMALNYHARIGGTWELVDAGPFVVCERFEYCYREAGPYLAPTGADAIGVRAQFIDSGGAETVLWDTIVVNTSNKLSENTHLPVLTELSVR